MLKPIFLFFELIKTVLTDCVIVAIGPNLSKYCIILSLYGLVTLNPKSFFFFKLLIDVKFFNGNNEYEKF